MALVGSISIAKRFSKPFTFVASLENFCPNASERLCAGSVDCVRGCSACVCVHKHERMYDDDGWKVLRTISRTDSRACDNWIAREHDVVVLPRQAQRRAQWPYDNTAHTLEKDQGGRTYASLST